MTDTTNIDRELEWEDTIENDGEDFVLLPAGDYDFTVTDFERERYAGGAKLPPCNKAVIHIKLDGGDLGTTTIKHNLFLHSKTEGLLCAFFTGIGQRQKGEKLQMNWQKVIGSTGRAKVSIRQWTNDKGEQVQFNEIKRFYEPDSGAAPAASSAPTYTPGNF